MKSMWNNAQKPSFDTLSGDVSTDVLVIGGGLCGILCAHLLDKAGVDCIVVEADKICGGVTNATTAKITFQHGLIYDKIMRVYNREYAYLYCKSQKEAFEKLTALAHSAECDLEFCNSFVYSVNDREVIENEVEALNKIGCKAQFCTDTQLPFDIAGAVMVKNQAMFHPLKFAYELARNLKIYENTAVTKINFCTAVTSRGKIKAKRIVFATHFPFINRYGGYFVKMYQHRSYVLALKNAADIKDMYVDEASDGLSFRRCRDLLLLGGGSHRTGKKGGGWTELLECAGKYYPDASEESRWATQDCMTLDSIPYIGRYSHLTPDWYVATGFNKWGMSSSMLSAMLICDMLLGKKSEYESLYSPSRSILHPQLAVNIMESAKNLILPTVPRCPHMGCALKYNRAEHSWDCPCHGSRFDSRGKLIENPAKRGMRKS